MHWGFIVVRECRIELVEGLHHSAPCVNVHRGKTFVVILNGKTIGHEDSPNIANNMGLLYSLSIRLIMVHGVRP